MDSVEQLLKNGTLYTAHWEVDGTSGSSEILAVNRKDALNFFAEHYAQHGYTLVSLD